MPLQLAVNFSQSEQFLCRECPTFGQGRPEDRSRMSLGKHETVVRGMVRLVDVEAEELEEDGGDQIGTGKAGCGMTRTGFRGGDQGMAPQSFGHFLKGSDLIGSDYRRIWI